MPVLGFSPPWILISLVFGGAQASQWIKSSLGESNVRSSWKKYMCLAIAPLL